MGARSKIIDALVVKIKTIDGSSPNVTNLFTNVYNKLKFWDEVNDFPSIFLNAGPETREYLPDFKWGHLTVTIRIYVNTEEPELALENIFTDIERIIDENGNLDYGSNNLTQDIKIMSITTDEGLLAPIGVGEITLQIMYDL